MARFPILVVGHRSLTAAAAVAAPAGAAAEATAGGGLTKAKPVGVPQKSLGWSGGVQNSKGWLKMSLLGSGQCLIIVEQPI